MSATQIFAELHIKPARLLRYPQFEELVFRRIDEWFGYPRPPDVEDEDEDEDEDQDQDQDEDDI